jgi:hypothetical protein
MMDKVHKANNYGYDLITFQSRIIRTARKVKDTENTEILAENSMQK